MDGIAAIKVSDIATLVPLGIAVGLAGLFLWVVLRTESWHMLRRRIWLLVHGREEISDPGIREYVEEQNNLAAFHVFAGVQVTTLAEARTLMAWCKARDVDLGVLRICGPYFDPEARRIKERWLPPRWVGHAIGAVAMVFVLAAAVSAWATALPALLTVKKTEQRFFADGTELHRPWPLLFPSARSLKPEDCDNPMPVEAARTGFTERDIAILCPLLKEPEFGTFVKNAAWRQRISLVVYAALFLFLMYYTGVRAFRVRCAHKLLNRRVDPALPAAQMELDFGAS